MAVVLHCQAPLLIEAERLLTEHKLPWEQVVGLDKDSILYENKKGKARTAWLERQPGTGRLKVTIAEGFQIEAP